MSLVGESLLSSAYKRTGNCPICQKSVIFESNYTWYRDHLFCDGCGSVPRERAVALTLEQYVPSWRHLRIHESSPEPRGISVKMQQQCSNYVATQFIPSQPLGVEYNGFRNENLECLTFPDQSFDVVVSLDVMEHVNDYETCFREIYRTLAVGGHYIFSAPTYKELVLSRRVARFLLDGSEEHYEPPEYHGNPVNEQGALVTFRYGYDFAELIAKCSEFDVLVNRFCDAHHGIIGEFTEVYVCTRN
jgi:SAM-dependent methyltransferase